jgi:hypothetical protein
MLRCVPEGQVVGYIKISVLGGRWSCLSRWEQIGETMG